MTMPGETEQLRLDLQTAHAALRWIAAGMYGLGAGPCDEHQRAWDEGIPELACSQCLAVATLRATGGA